MTTQTRFFCTYFDSGYLTRGLALVESLRRHCPSFRLWIVCMDERAYESLQGLNAPELTLVRLAEMEQWDGQLAAARANRSLMEFYFTCSPIVPLFVLKHASEIDLLTYLDGDLYFFSPPDPVFEEIGDADVGIIAHRFRPALRHYEELGRYNVGFLSFRRSDEGLRCLSWWRERCLEWCHDRLEGDRYADQKYLDRWPSLFKGVVELQQKGANLGPWNVANYSITLRGDEVRIDEDPLVFFHFHGLKLVAPGVYNPQLRRYGTRPTPPVRKLIYQPYLQALQRATRVAASMSNGGAGASLRSIRGNGQAARPGIGQRLRETVMSVKKTVGHAYHGDLIYYLGDHVV